MLHGTKQYEEFVVFGEKNGHAKMRIDHGRWFAHYTAQIQRRRTAAVLITPAMRGYCP
jgi:hypothetical protein